MKRFHSLFVLGLAAVFFCGCASTTTSLSDSKPRAGVGPNGADTEGGSAAVDDSTNRSLTKGNPVAYAHFAAGVSYEASDRFAQALTEFRHSANADPSNEPLVIDVARDLLKGGKTDDAISLLSKSAREPSASGLLLSWLARAQLQAGRTNEALTASRSAVQKSPSEFDSYESLIEVLFQTRRYGEAVQTLDLAAKNIHGGAVEWIALADFYTICLSVQPDKTAEIKVRTMNLLERAAKDETLTAQSRQRIAEIYNRIGRQKQAAEIYTKLLNNDTLGAERRDEIRDLLVNLYLHSNDAPDAIKQLEGIVRDSPARYPQAWYALGVLNYGAGKLTNAVDDFKSALTLNPGLEDAYFDLALAQIDLDQTDAAFLTLDKARAKYPGTFSIEFFTGLAFARVKNYAEAVRHFTSAEVIGEASDKNRLDKLFYYQVGAACHQNKQFKEAAEYLQKAIHLDPKFGEALNYLGYMWADRGENLSKARTLIEKAVELEPKNPAYLDSLGWVLFKLNQPRRALSFLLKAEKFSPEPDATILDHVGEVYMALHEVEKAREAWKKSLSIEPSDDVRKKLEHAPGVGS